MKIAVINTHFKMGGIRQSLLNLLEALKNEDVEIDLYILTGDRKAIQAQAAEVHLNSIFVLQNTDIYYRTLGRQKSYVNRGKKLLIGTMCKTIGREQVLKFLIAREELPDTEYDTVISYSNGIWTGGSRRFSGGCEFVADRLRGKKKVAWIHSNPEFLGITQDIGSRIYTKFDKIVNVSYGCKEIFDGICPDLVDSSIVIYNLCNSERVRCLMNVCNPYPEGFHIVTVARLDNRTKRLDRLAMCCKLLKDAGYSFQWHVVGDGKDMPLLRELRDSLQLQNELIIEGRQENPFPYMKNADLYVCTSAYEAFPMVLKEAFLCGTPAVTTPIPSAKEIIQERKNGFISDGFEPEDIVREIEKVLQSRELLQGMRAKIHDDARRYEDDIHPFLQICGREKEC